MKLDGAQFGVLSSSSTTPFPLTALVSDTVDLGNDGYPGPYAIVLTDRDSVRFNYTNVPFDQAIYIPLALPTGKATYRLRFNGVPGQFSDSYVQRHTDRKEFEIPEVYELANILWLLSEHGKTNASLPKSGPYYQQVVTHFKPFLTHPIFTRINQLADTYANYYDFRENSYAYHFEQDKLMWTGPHYYVTGSDLETFNSLFRQLAPLVEDFAKKSGYRAFYQQQQPYYQQLIVQERQLMPVRQMWTWLEARFPQRFSCYRIVFSPLIGGSHSTQQYARYIRDRLYKEAVMFVNGPTPYTIRTDLTALEQQGLASGVVFTEIDHNYVNPTTSRFKKSVDSIFTNRPVWTKLGGDTDSYGSPQAVFNEYMTHALFCLYIKDQYDTKTAAYIVGQRVKLMEEHRHYIRFNEFTQKLSELYSLSKPSESIANLYPALLDWAKQIK